MNLYNKYIYPRLVKYQINKSSVFEYRRKLLSNVNGKILEIGFGTGSNLDYYPEVVKEIYAVDKSKYFKEKRISHKIKINFFEADVSSLPFENNAFDFIVSTFTLCSIKDINCALKEINRILKPDGVFLFLEHGIANDKKIVRKQNKYNFLYNIFGDGCNLNRNIENLISKYLKITDINKFYCKKLFKIISYLYMGKAIKTYSEKIEN